MHFLEQLARRLRPKVSAAKADGLWRRYLLGLALMMGLILTANYANRTALEIGRVDGRILQDIGQLQMLTQRVVILAKSYAFIESSQTKLENLRSSITRIEDLRLNMAERVDLPVELQQALFSEPIKLDERLALFVDVATEFQTAAGTGVGIESALIPLRDMAEGELPDLLDSFLEIFTATSEQSTARMLDLQTLILAVAIFVLVLEALFVYVPAHFIVNKTLANLRSRALALNRKKEELSRANSALSKAAKQDALTGLPNRSYLIEILSRALKNPKDHFHVLTVDIDRLRAINDAAGDATGDLLLKHVGITLQRTAQKTDFVARTGGDEFVVVTRSKPADLAEAIVRRFARPITLGGRICQTGLSVGYTSRTASQTDALALLSDAELALKEAKSQGRNQISVYTQKMRAAIADRDLLLAEIPDALAEGQIMPFYQPQISLESGHIAGVEVLARWIHPTRGRISPDDFLPLVTQEGFARKLDFVIWERAMAQLKRWRLAGLVVPHISLNAGPDTIADPKFVGHLLDLMDAYDLGPEDLAIEVLETTFTDNIFAMAALNIDRLIAAGVTVELDDFGTGYTSLSTLIELSLSAVKLDRSLIEPLPAPRAQSILRAVVALAKEMNFRIIAEGIETKEQSEYLRHIGCDVGQGYGIGRPMTARDFTTWIADPSLWAPRPRNVAAHRA